MTSPTALTQHAEMEFRMLSELRQPRSWERDVTGGRWREVENKAECHSLTGVLTIIGCHHFLIRPVSKKCSNKTAVQGWPPSLLYSHTHTHTDVQRRVIDVHARHTEMHKQIKRVRKVPRTDPERLCYTELPAVGISQIRPPRKGSRGVASRQLIELKVFLARVEK